MNDISAIKFSGNDKDKITGSPCSIIEYYCDSCGQLVTIKGDEIKPKQPQYREPTAEDVGKMVEVCERGSLTWVEKKLLIVLSPSLTQFRFVCQNNEIDDIQGWKYVRIKVEE